MGRNVFQSFATLSGNGVTLIVDTQQLDKCNNNLSEENEALGKCRSKTSESLSKHSSNSSSGPVSSSSATQSSSSDVVSMRTWLFWTYTLRSSLGGVTMYRGARPNSFLICYWEILVTALIVHVSNTGLKFSSIQQKWKNFSEHPYISPSDFTINLLLAYPIASHSPIPVSANSSYSSKHFKVNYRHQCTSSKVLQCAPH